MKVSKLNGDVSPVRIYYNGLVWWRPGDVFRTSCYPDIYKYPFDSQECRISILASGFTEQEVLLQIPGSEADTSIYTDNGEWVLLKTRPNSYDQNQLSVAQWYFTFKRRPQFFFFNVIMPIIFLSLLDCLVYCIPVQSGERISYAITVLLSFAVFMTLISDNIPKTSAPMSLFCIYLFSVFTGSGMIMISTIFNLKLFYTDQSKEISQMVRSFTVFMLRKRWCQGRSVQPNTTVIQVMEKPGKEDGCINNNMKISKEREPEVWSPEYDDITWKDVAQAVDRLSFAGFVAYFTVATIGHLLVIAL